MIRLSLIIPTHNRAGQLLAALESVVRQDMPAGEWECVVADDSSASGSSVRKRAIICVSSAGLNASIESFIKKRSICAAKTA